MNTNELILSTINTALMAANANLVQHLELDMTKIGPQYGGGFSMSATFDRSKDDAV